MRWPVRVIFGAILVTILTCTNVYAYRDSGQVVNYADFKYVTSIATSASRVYVGTTQGIIIYNKNQEQWESPLAGLDGIDNGSVQKVWVDRFGERLFAETAAGKYEFDVTFGRWVSAFDVPNLSSDDVHITPPAVMYPPFGYDYNGNGGLIDQQARLYNITDIVDDGAGSLWIGTWGHGLLVAGSLAKTMKPLPYGLLQNAVYALCEQDSVLYVAGPALSTRRFGITIFDLRRNSFRFIDAGPGTQLPSADIQCLDVDKKNLYVGTAEGLYVIDKSGNSMAERAGRLLNPSQEDFTAVRAVGDSIYAGTTDGLFCINRKSDSILNIAPNELGNHTVFDLAPVETYLWIGSDVGAYRLSLETGKLQKYQDPDQLLFNRVFNLSAYGRALWLSSDAGAVRINLDSGTTRPFRQISSLIGARAIAANDRIAALASDQGLTIVFLDQDKWYSRDFSTNDGLLSNLIYGLVLDGEYLWVATDHGLTRFWWNNRHTSD